MRGLKQNLVYWGRTLESALAIVLLGSAAYALMMGIFGDGFTGDGFWLSVLAYSVCMVFIVNTFNSVNLYFPLTVSMGSTRKASYMAMQMVQHLIMLQYLLLVIIVCVLWERELFEGMLGLWQTVIGVVLLLLTVSNVTGICVVKFGKIIGTAVYIVGLFAMVLSVMWIVACEGDATGVLRKEIVEFIKGSGFLVTGILADGAAVGVYYRVLKKKDLKFG